MSFIEVRMFAQSRKGPPERTGGRKVYAKRKRLKRDKEWTAHIIILMFQFETSIPYFTAENEEIHCDLCVFFEFFVVRLGEKRWGREKEVLGSGILVNCRNHSSSSLSDPSLRSPHAPPKADSAGQAG